MLWTFQSAHEPLRVSLQDLQQVQMRVEEPRNGLNLSDGLRQKHQIGRHADVVPMGNLNRLRDHPSYADMGQVSPLSRFDPIDQILTKGLNLTFVRHLAQL